MDTPAPTLDATEQRELMRWRSAGLDELTGPEHGPGLAPPVGLLPRLDAVTERIRSASAAFGVEVGVDGPAELSARARALGLRRRGRVSCGGSCHLVRAADGWFAVSLCRPDDWDLLPAWIDLPSDTSENWDRVHLRCEELRRDELVGRGALLGLPIGALPAPLTHEAVQPAAAVQTLSVPRALEPGHHRTRTERGEPLRVADLSSMWAGPLCGSVLAAAGAQVIKVESTTRPDGLRRGAPSEYERLNARKASRFVDLASEQGRNELLAVLRSVDVVIESSRPRALRQLGIHAEELLAAPDGPALWVSITGHGRHGDAAQRVAFGDDAAVAGGLVAWWQGEPVFCADAIADPLTGLSAAAATLEALGGPAPVLLDVAMSRVGAHFAGRQVVLTSPTRR